MRYRPIILSVALATTVVALVAATTNSSGAAGRDPAAGKSAASPLTAAQITYAQSIRRQFGLQYSRDYIEKVAAQPGADTKELGTPLTSEEAANIAGRQVVNQTAQKAQDLASADPSFAGLWMDQAAGGVLWISYVGTGGKSTFDKLAAQVVIPAGVTVKFKAAKYSVSNLKAAQIFTRKFLSVKTGPGRFITESGIVYAQNRLVVHVLASAPAGTVEALQALLPPTAKVVSDGTPFRQESTRNFTTGPLYGGEWVYQGGEQCTAAYSYFTNVYNQRYSVTAGHCLNGTYIQGKFGKGAIIGGGHNNRYVNIQASTCDCVAIGPLPSALTTNQVLTTNNGLFGYTAIATQSSYKEGETVFVSGAASYDVNGGNLVEGTITSVSADVPETGSSFTLDDAVQTTAKTTGGDSGAPVGNGPTFLGVHAGSTGTGGIFSKAPNVTADLGLIFAH